MCVCVGGGGGRLKESDRSRINEFKIMSFLNHCFKRKIPFYNLPFLPL